MHKIVRLYHFLGSIHFAITLIAAVALFVIAGTLIESKMESHRYASHFTYDNPVFIGLLYGFFINILFSALRRWPFQIHHAPFLITHLGLLMILGGALIKSYAGIQGTMMIMEGSASQKLFLSDTYVIQVEKNGNDPLAPSEVEYYPVKQKFLRGFDTDLSDATSELNIKLLGYQAHSSERLETWIKGSFGVISGFKPFVVHDWSRQPEQLPVSSHVELDSQQWDIIAGRTSSIAELAKKAYLQGLKLILTDTLTHEILYQGAFAELVEWSEGKAKFTLELSYNPLHGFGEPKLLALFEPTHDKIEVPLQGAEALININLTTPYLGKASVTIDLIRTPILLMLQDSHHETHLFAFDAHGQVHAEIFRCSNLSPLIVYDRGFGGYAVKFQLPGSKNRSDREKMYLQSLEFQLQHGQQQLSLPLQMLKDASESANAEFSTTTLEFLSHWNETHSWLYPENVLMPGSLMPIMSRLNWEKIPSRERKACFWIHSLFIEIEKHLAKGEELHSILQTIGWPLKTSNDPAAVLTTLMQQVFMITDQLPEIEFPTPLSVNTQARLLSAYLRAYAIHLSNLKLPTEDILGTLSLECPITVLQQSEAPQKKLEENVPKIVLEVCKGTKKEKIALTYDRYGQGLKWPIFNGEYLLRFQPQIETIPYKIRLRNARQINYANSSQPFSYESDLIITDTQHESYLEKTISMNHVHETWDGYRFYLANIAPPNETAVKRVQIIVNHDPAKYFLTYPGAIILTIGIILLFWLRPYNKKR